jgi:hypothetical protein
MLLQRQLPLVLLLLLVDCVGTIHIERRTVRMISLAASAGMTACTVVLILQSLQHTQRKASRSSSMKWGSLQAVHCSACFVMQACCAARLSTVDEQLRLLHHCAQPHHCRWSA